MPDVSNYRCIDMTLTMQPGVISCILLLLLAPLMQAGDEIGDVFLTPSWDLMFGVGERVDVDCGVFTNGTPAIVSITWTHPNTGVVSDVGKRVYTTQIEKLHPDDTDMAAFTVLTLHVTEVTSQDVGEYVCKTEELMSSVTQQKSIHLDVTEPSYVCNFETTLCGWRIDNTSSIQWHHHDSNDVTSVARSKGLRHDHTYGATTDTGHFLDVDIGRSLPTDLAKEARLLSPTYEALDNTSMCFHFWFNMHGTDVGSLTVWLEPILSANSGNTTKLLYLDGLTNTTNGEWQTRTVDITPQTTTFRLIMEAILCTTNCRQGTVAIDDIHMHEGTCADVIENQPETKVRVRVVDGSSSSSGRVEVLHSGQWGTVCGEHFDDAAAAVVCRSLGLPVTKAHSMKTAFSRIADSNYIIWLDNLQCQGHEPDLGSCLMEGVRWGQTQCTHAQDAGVSCSYDSIPTSISSAIKPLISSSPSPPPSTTTTTAAATKTKAEAAATTTVSTTAAVSSSSAISSTRIVSSTLPIQKNGSTTIKPPVSASSILSSSSWSPIANSTMESTEDNVNIRRKKRNAGAAVAITIFVIVIIAVLMIFVYRKKRGVVRKSNYIVFDNPKYQRENLPSNDMSMMDSTLSDMGPILA